MDVTLVTALIALGSSALTGAIGYLSGKGKDRLTDRELLSKDEQIFRTELREQLKENQEKIDRLSNEIVVLRRENMELVAENRLLNSKLEDIVKGLSRRSNIERRWEDEED